MDKDDTMTKKDDWEKIYDDLEKKYPQTSGWICPKCGVVNAPWVSQCPCVSNYNWPYPYYPYVYPKYTWGTYTNDPNTGQPCDCLG